jgi:phosphoribosylformylglycinamidine synthase
MAFAGGLGAEIRLQEVPHSFETETLLESILLFSESNTRFLCEVPSSAAEEFVELMEEIPHALVGEVTDSGRLEVIGIGDTSISAPMLSVNLAELKEIWQAPLDWS